MKLGLELDNLTKRGIEMKFTSKSDIHNFSYHNYDVVPKFVFILGNKELLTDENTTIVYKYLDYKKNESNKNIIFITDRSFNALLKHTDIVNKIKNKSLVLVSDVYRTKSNLEIKNKKSIISPEKQKKVFISGSRSQKEIPQNIQKSLRLIMKQNIEVLIGDSNKGVDKEIIDYFRGIYNKVEIFTIKDKPRVIVETEWKQKTIETIPSLKAQEKQMMKDRVMADDADWGLAVFNPLTKNRYGLLQVSSGTLRNTIQLLLNKKPVKFFYLFENEIIFKNLKTIEDLEKVIFQYRKEKLSQFGVDEITADIKFRKIFSKFQELLRKEQEIINKKNEKSEPIEEIKQKTIFDIE